MTSDAHTHTYTAKATNCRRRCRPLRCVAPCLVIACRLPFAFRFVFVFVIVAASAGTGACARACARAFALRFTVCFGLF